MEKLQRNRFEKAVQEVNQSSKDWLEQEFKAILESNKPYEVKADYIGYSISSIDEKIAVLDSQIKELKAYKDKLKLSKEIVLTTGADVFNQYGITKIEGGGISSITMTQATSTTKLEITEILNENLLIEQGFYTKVLDKKKILKYYTDNQYRDLLEKCCRFNQVVSNTPSKIKINKRRAVNNSNKDLQINAA